MSAFFAAGDASTLTSYTDFAFHAAQFLQPSQTTIYLTLR